MFTILTAKVIHYFIYNIYIFFSKKYLCHNYVSRHSRMRQIEPLKKIQSNMPPNSLAMYCKTPNSLKNYTSMFKKIDLRPLMCALDLYAGNAIII